MLKVMLLSASARHESLNSKLAQAIRDRLSVRADIEVDEPGLALSSLPVYDGDLEQEQGVPNTARVLASRWAEADAVIICTPEYNGGIPGSLKNAIDWISRLKPHPIAGKWLLLTGASPGALGAVRGLWHTRVPFEALGAMVYPEMFGLSLAHTVLGDGGELKDASKSEQLERLLSGFLSRVPTVVPVGLRVDLG